MLTTTRTTYNTTYGNLGIELSQKPSGVMDYKKEFFKLSPNGDRAVVGYLVDDSDCQNPLNNEGMGEIVTARRHAKVAEHAKMQAALGLDSEWHPDFDLLDSAVVKARFIKLVVENNSTLGGPALESVQAQAENVFDYGDVGEYPQFATANRQVWEEARRDGTIGNPLAVSLDVYEHSGVSYTVSTGTRTNDFDTASGGALWIPDDTVVENLMYRAKQSLLPEGTEVKYHSHDDVLNDIIYKLPDGTTVGGFKSFTGAIDAAATALAVTFDKEQLAAAARKFAIKEAESVARVYTDWSNGNTFGFVIDEFELADDGNWERIEENTSYGYIGDDDAMQQMESEAQALADHHKAENEKTFVSCSEQSLNVLENARHSAYDHERGGVTMTMTSELMGHLKTMPADFTIIAKSEASKAASPDSAVAEPRRDADTSPAP